MTFSLLLSGAVSLSGSLYAATAPVAGKPAAKAAAGRTRTTAAKPKPRAETRKPEQLAHDARELEDAGAYARALVQWRALRGIVARDGDLELAIAIDEARSGEVDSAMALLASPALSAAADDSLPAGRNTFYGSQREPIYSNGTFDGWRWYVWRARAELALARGRWEESAVAARVAVRARPLSGKDWLLLAVAAGRAGHDDEAREAASRAATLDGGLPEACYLDGVWAWRSGRRLDAQKAFRAAVDADRTFQPAGLALVRLRLPGAQADSLPATFLTGAREAAILTSPVGPKMEDFAQFDRPVVLSNKIDPAVPDSLKQGLFGYRLPLWVLVDETGRVVLNEVAWTKPDQISPLVVADLVRTLRYWTFMPALVHGEPRRAWVDLLYAFAL